MSYAVDITPESAGWGFSGLRVLELAPGQSHAFNTGADELIVLPLNGGCTATVDDQAYTLLGREDVFSGVTDFLYVPHDAHVEVASDGGGRFAIPSSRTDRRLEVRYVPADAVSVEVRGAGNATRQVNNFCSVEGFEAGHLIAVEVLTPGGNWSSYPPHRHDDLEEIYYFEIARGGFGYQRVYDGLDVLAEVRTGDTVEMPCGYHGPSMAAPGYDMYYLNVMAGPVREWNFVDDPAHAWIRTSWADQAPDPRVPMTSARRQP